MGELIIITRRKCSDKVQPKIKLGKMYLVVDEVEPTKSGARVILIADFETIAQRAITNPHDNIDPKMIMRCNSDRFEWKLKSKSRLKKEFAKKQIQHYEEVDKQRDASLQAKFTNEERERIAYIPYLFAELSWHYAYKAIELAVERRIDEHKKPVRRIKQLREEFLSELRHKMTQPILEAGQLKVKEAMDIHAVDLFKFELTVKNEVERVYLGYQHNDIRAYAYMSMLCYESLRDADNDNVNLIVRKVGGAPAEVASYKCMKEMYYTIWKLLGEHYIEHNLNIDISVKVLKKNIKSMRLTG